MSNSPAMSTSPSPALPWEVIERVINHSADSIITLCNFTLTCRELRPRSTMVLLCRIEFKTRNQIFSLCAVLQAKPYLQPFLRWVKIPVSEFSPVPLLRVLPNPLEIEFFDNRAHPGGWHYPVTLFHPAVTRHCRQFGRHIRTLSFKNLTFPSIWEFSDILLSFPGMKFLSCGHLSVKNESVPQEPVIQRLSKRLHVQILTVSILLFRCRPMASFFYLSLLWNIIRFPN